MAKRKKLSARQIARNYDLLARELNQCSEQCEDAKRGRSRAEGASVELDKRVKELKKKLIDAERRIADLQGYLRRVHEDDTVREPLVTLPDIEECRKNGGTGLMPQRHVYRSAPFTVRDVNLFDREEKKDWRDY